MRKSERFTPRALSLLAGILLVGDVRDVNAGTPDAQVVVLPRFSDWRYDDTGTDLGVAWRDTTFDDSGWAEGQGFLGYGEEFITTEVSFGPNANDKYPTTYFRATFALDEDPANVQRLSLGANIDDGVVIYLNGQEVVRDNMPAGPILYGTFASTTEEGEDHVLFDLSAWISLLVTGPNHLAVELHQRSATSSDLVWDTKVQYTTESTLLVRGPYLQVGTPTGIRVRWRTDLPATGLVWYGTAPDALDDSVTGTAGVTEHEIELTDLDPATRYYYAIGTDEPLVLAGGDTDHTFRTHPVVGTDDETVRIWAIGDSGEASLDQAKIPASYLGHPGADETDVWLLLGDNAYDDGLDAEYTSGLFEPFRSTLRKMIAWPTRGNHDNLHTTEFDYYDIFTMPTAGEAGGVPSGDEAYYSFDYANIHFVCLDSDGTSPSPDSTMITWLGQDLAATTQDWLIAYWHHPPYTKGSHNSDNVADSGGRMRDMRENALPVLEAGGVDLVLSGHSHSYERSFLIDGHYGVSSTFADSMWLHGGSGALATGGPYTKGTDGLAPHEGTVYAVAGSASFTDAGPLNHPVMYASMREMGTMVIDVLGNQLDAAFLDTAGVVRDEFTIIKGITIATPEDPGLEPGAGLRVSRNPTPAGAVLRYTVSTPGPVALRVIDGSGRLVRELVREDRSPGRYEVSWDGRDGLGRRVAPAVYYVLLQSVDGVSTRKLVLMP